MNSNAVNGILGVVLGYVCHRRNLVQKVLFCFCGSLEYIYVYIYIYADE